MSVASNKAIIGCNIHL